MQVAIRSLSHRRRLTDVIPDDFNPRVVTFTGGMAKRAGTVFAGAPLVQGKWDGSGTPDVLSFTRGTQISGHWYDNFDAYQGGGFLTWTPEQSSADRTDSNFAYIWSVSSNYNLRYEYDNNRYRLKLGGQTMVVSATLTAGTVEYLAWGFDTNNDLDGPNYSYLSRNDTQTYGIASQPTAEAPGATVYIGSFNGTTFPANGIIEGLVFVREVPWNGNFGSDMGQGDIVAAHAAGNDVQLSIASWGVTYSMPTDATPGALTTGEGEAYSHPHSSNLLGVGAFMMDGTYTNDGWADEGTPTAVAALAAAEKIFNGGYKVTSDAANEGIYKDISLSAGDDVVIRASGYSDGTSVPKVILYDQDNAAEIGSITGSNASTRAAPDVFLFTGEAPAGCTTMRVKLINTDATAADITYWNEAPVYDNLITNPSLEVGAGNPWIPTGWTNVNFAAGEAAQDAADFHSGASALSIVNSASGHYMLSNQFTPGLGAFVSLGLWAKESAGNLRVIDPTGTEYFFQYSASSYYVEQVSGNVWTHYGAVARVDTANPVQMAPYAAAINTSGKLDDLYAIAMDPVSITATPASEANSTEDTGLRVDGRDACTQVLTHLTPTRGRMRWKWTPRHDSANFDDFTEAAGHAYLVNLRYDASNYIFVEGETTSRVELSITVGGVTTNDNPALAGLFTAGTTYNCEIRYTSSRCVFLVDGVEQIVLTPAAGINFGASVPNVAHWGSSHSDIRQGDATFAAP